MNMFSLVELKKKLYLDSRHNIKFFWDTLEKKKKYFFGVIGSI
jgi:hypothetical protein